MAGRRAGLGGEVRRPVAVAHLQGCHGNGQFSMLIPPLQYVSTDNFCLLWSVACNEKSQLGPHN